MIWELHIPHKCHGSQQVVVDTKVCKKSRIDSLEISDVLTQIGNNASDSFMNNMLCFCFTAQYKLLRLILIFNTTFTSG